MSAAWGRALLTLPLPLAVAAAVFLTTFGALAQPPLGIGTTSQGSLSYGVGAALSRLLLEKAGLRSLVQPNHGTGVMVPLVNAGEIDLGIASISELADAFLGQGQAMAANPNLRIVGRLFPIRVGLFVATDSSVRTVADLKGLRLPWGYNASPNLTVILAALLANGGLEPGDIRPVLVPNLIRGANSFKSGDTDAGFFAVGAGKVSEVAAAVGGIRYLPLDTSAPALARMHQVMPLSYPVRIEPRRQFAGITEPIDLFAYDYVLFAGSHVDAGTIEKVARALAHGKSFLAANLGVMRLMDPAKVFTDYGRPPLHDGVLQYLSGGGGDGK